MHVLLNRFRVISLPLLWLVGILIFLLGCGGTVPTPGAAETPLAEKSADANTLTLWHTFDDERGDTLVALTREFHKIYPDLTINPVFVGTHDDLSKQMTAAIALGNVPDIVLAERRQIGEFAEQGGLQPLDKFLNDPELGLTRQDRDDFLRGMLQLGTYPTMNNRVYGFPFHQEAFVLFYNADMLKQLNIEHPPRTWDEFGEYSALATAQGTYGWAMRANADTFEAMLASRGSALLTNAEGRGLFNERAGLASMQLVAALAESGQAKLATSDEKARLEFASGSAAYYLGWMSELDLLRRAQQVSDTDFDIGVGILPQLDPQTPWLLTRGDLFAIPRISPERARDAWFFIRWMTTPSTSARWVRGTDALPLRISALDFIAPDAAPNLFYDQVLKTFEDVPPRLASQPAHFYSKTVEQAVSEVWLQAVQPKADLPAILDNLLERVNQILSVKP